MATKLCTDRLRVTFAVLAAVVVLLANNSWIQILVIGLGGVAGWKLLSTKAATETAEPFPLLPSRRLAFFSLALFAFCLLLVPALAAGKRDGWLPLFDSFYRSGSLVFGGGHVVLPLLQAEVVPKGWEDNSAFLAGYGLAQSLPGPLFSFAAYLGTAKSGYPTGWLAGLWCLFAILLPPMLLVNGLLPFWNRLRGSPSARAVLAGANATVVGVLLAALYQPIWTSAIDSPKSLSLALLLFCCLQFWKIAPWILVGTAAICGGLFLCSNSSPRSCPMKQEESKMRIANRAFRFVVTIGIVSLFADMTYEGARGITGPFLGSLGASATAIGLIVGFAELIGYGLRSVSGYFADSTHQYWAFIFVGYATNLLAVPALALAGNWPAAAALIVVERTGRAIRRPAVQAMISHAGQTLGHGWVFGLHEALDQAGATIGPLITALILYLRGSYQNAFAVLLISALLWLL